MEAYLKQLAKLIAVLLSVLRGLWKHGRSNATSEAAAAAVQEALLISWAEACSFVRDEAKRQGVKTQVYIPPPPVYTAEQFENLVKVKAGERGFTKEATRDIERSLTRMVRKSANSTVKASVMDNPETRFIDADDRDNVVAQRWSMVYEVLDGKTVNPVVGEPTRRDDRDNQRRREKVKVKRESDREYRKRVLEHHRRVIEAERKAEAEQKRKRSSLDAKAERKLPEPVAPPKPLSDTEIKSLLRWRNGNTSQAVGYARVVTGEWTCGFCIMLASRGAVYKNASVAGERVDVSTGALYNSYHYNCDCIVVPVFGNKKNYIAYEHSQYYYQLYKEWYEHEYSSVSKAKPLEEYHAWKRERGLPEYAEGISDLDHFLEYKGFQGAYARPSRKRKRKTA